MKTRSELYWIDRHTLTYKQILFFFIVWLVISFLVYLGMLRADAQYAEFMARPDAGQILFLEPYFEIPGDSYWMIIGFWFVGSLIAIVYLLGSLYNRICLSLDRKKGLI